MITLIGTSLAKTGLVLLLMVVQLNVKIVDLKEHV